jgi:hypothetical protein
MRLSVPATVIAAVVAFLILGAGAMLLLQPPRSLLTDVTVRPAVISPNGDGVDDAAKVTYTLNRNARVSMTFTHNQTKDVYTFRSGESRGADKYEVLFGGLVPGFRLASDSTDAASGEILTRLIPNGAYSWTVSATTDSGETASISGPLIVSSADDALPVIQAFTVSPTVFTPNQDGIDDRVAVNAYLPKKADLSVYLLATDGTRYDLPERVELRDAGAPGAHFFDYDGGVDLLIKPPPNGAYRLIAETQDVSGQRFRRESKLTIADGGQPQVEIQPQATGAQVFWAALPAATLDVPTRLIPEPLPTNVTSLQARITLPQNDLLVFRLVVHNYGDTPIRTLAPWPGTIYRWQDYYAGKVDPVVSRSGVWFVGLNCDTSETNLPYRWAIGAPDQLTKVTRADETYYYLMPGQRATVWGAIQMSKLVRSRNPQECFAALIHEDIEIPPLQSRVGPIAVELSPSPSP